MIDLDELERLRAENERLRAKLEDIDRIGRDALRKGGHPSPDDGNAAYAIGWLEARNDRKSRATQPQREAAIYGAVFANAYPHVSTRVAMSHAEDAVEAWRAAQNGAPMGNPAWGDVCPECDFCEVECMCQRMAQRESERAYEAWAAREREYQAWCEREAEKTQKGGSDG